jgi:F-type H+-transporting ATPase subunit epsilon
MTKLKLKIITPDYLVHEGEAYSVGGIGVDGSFTVLPKHAPMIVTLVKGELKIIENEETGKTFYVMIDSGILEVSDNNINILVQSAMKADESNVAEMKMEFEKQQRDERNLVARERVLESELKLRRLLREASDIDVK